MNYSEDLSALAPALAKFQGEVANPANTAVNPHFRSKYAPLNDILNYVRPLLARQGLSVFQSTVSDGNGRAGVATMLLHNSGQFVESDPVMLKDRKDDAQGAGSAITYARRYSLCAALGIASEDDDDGNAAVATGAAKPRKAPRKRPPAKQDDFDGEVQKWVDVFADIAARGDLAEFRQKAEDLSAARRGGKLTVAQARQITPAFRKAEEACGA